MNYTIRDIAKLTGFSRSTVSRVLTDSPRVDPETRKKILQTIKEINFSPNGIARSLVKGHTNLIALIIGDIANPFYAELTKAIEQVLYARGYMIVLCHSNYENEKEEKYIEAAKEYNFTGIIMVTATETETLVDKLKTIRCPLVLVNRYLPSFNTDTVLADNYKGGYLATKHLIVLGHKHIGHICGPQTSTASEERLRGYKDAMKGANLYFDESYIFQGNLKKDSGEVYARYLLDNKKEITGVFCGNDLMASGLIDVFLERGKSIPEDLSVVGYDNSKVAIDSKVKITTVALSHFDMGKCAANLILERLENKNSPFRQISFNPVLIERNSTKALI